MTRIDMTAREWHALLKPVLPHASTDPDLPELAVVRIEVTAAAVYAVATDRRTLGAERFRPETREELGQPIHVNAKEAAASLKVFAYSKDFDPLLHVVIDTAPIPITVVGQPRSVNRLAVTIQAEDGTRLMLHDVRDPSRDALVNWRAHIAGAMARPAGHILEGFDLNPGLLSRWGHAARKGERLTFYTGPQPGDALLVTVEDHFAGLWTVPQYLDGPAKTRSERPWIGELDGTGIDHATGERLDGGQ